MKRKSIWFWLILGAGVFIFWQPIKGLLMGIKAKIMPSGTTDPGTTGTGAS